MSEDDRSAAGNRGARARHVRVLAIRYLRLLQVPFDGYPLLHAVNDKRMSGDRAGTVSKYPEVD
jgi:hypothetical protein